MARVYLASSWRNPKQAWYVAFLREEGHQVYDFKHPPHGPGGFSWSEIDKDWQNWSVPLYRKHLYDHPRCAQGFMQDLQGMLWANVCVLLMPCGRSAHIEAGWMAGRDKHVIVHFPAGEGFEPELMYLCTNGITHTISELSEALSSL